MSNYNSSLAFEELGEQNEEVELKLVVKSRHLSYGSDLPEMQPLSKVVRVTGNITISF